MRAINFALHLNLNPYYFYSIAIQSRRSVAFCPRPFELSTASPDSYKLFFRSKEGRIAISRFLLLFTKLHRLPFSLAVLLGDSFMLGATKTTK